MHIYLIGMMGAGKSTVGRALATEINRPFWDTDQAIVSRTGVAVTTIFELEGEAGFRQREMQELARLGAFPPAVIATGGGLPISDDNARALADTGTVIYLYVDREVLWSRLRRDKSRPLLKTEHPKETLDSLLSLREPVYRKRANFVIDVGQLSVHQAVSQIKDHLDAMTTPVDKQK